MQGAKVQRNGDTAKKIAMIFSESGKIIVALQKRQKTQKFQKKKDCIAEKTEIQKLL
jgi:hypothetical protein